MDHRKTMASRGLRRAEEEATTDDWVVLRRALLILLLLALAALVWMLANVLLLAFGAVLVSLILRGLSDELTRRLGLGERWAFLVVVVLLLAGIAGLLWLFGAQIAAQFDELSQSLSRAIGRAEQLLDEASWGPWALDQMRDVGGDNATGLVKRLTGFLGTTFGAVGEAVLMLVSGIYLAAQPRLYRAGFLNLVPDKHVDRARRLMNATARALRRWLLGQGAAMLAIFAVTTPGLWLMDVPSALALGIIAGVTEFIPFIGPLLGAIPAVLIGLSVSPTMALWIALFYFAVQQLENHLLMPIIQSRVTALPPVLTLFATVVAGFLFGLLGVLFATPLAVMTVVAVQVLYVEGMLGKKIALLGDEPEEAAGRAAERSTRDRAAAPI
jgi:predicted PurR-regulated permease PerM